MKTKSITQIRKFLYGIMLVGVMILICFGLSGTPAVRAQTADTPTATAKVKPPKPTGPNTAQIAHFTSSEVMLKDGR